jgi:acyl-CoA thioester hydrolase
VQVTQAGRASMTLAQQAWRGAELLTEGTIRIACVDAGTFAPRRIPIQLQHITE